MSHAPPEMPAFTASSLRASTRNPYHSRARPRWQLHSRAFTRHAPQSYDVMDDVILHYTVWPVCPDDSVWPGPTWKSDPDSNRLPKKKKKRERENALTLTKKSKFPNGPVPLNSSSTFWFWNPFLHSKLRNYANIQFPKSWLLCKCWPNVKIFKMDLSCSIFRVHFDFGVRSVIWDSKIAQMTRFQGSWLLCWSRPKVKIFKLDLSCLVFRGLETTNLTYFSEVLAVSKT